MAHSESVQQVIQDIRDSGITEVQMAQEMGYGTRPILFMKRLSGERQIDDAFRKRLVRLRNRIYRGETKFTQPQMVPKETWQRLLQTGMSYVQIARALGEFPGATCNRRLRGELPVKDEFLAKVNDLVDRIKDGRYKLPDSTRKHVPNPGGHFAMEVDAFEPPLPPHPTDAPAGSAEKVAVMHARAAAGYALRHPDDNEMHAPIGNIARMAAIVAAMADDEIGFDVREEDDDA